MQTTGSNERKGDGRGQLYRWKTIDIDVLPDEVLLEVFNFYLDRDRQLYDLDQWHKLVHVCRRWRLVVFASPRRLDLRLLCTGKTPVKKLLGVWPTLPIVIEGYGTRLGLRGVNNIDAALEHNDRVCEITIRPVEDSLLNTLKEPFPALTSLRLWSYNSRVPVLPDSFLGGFAPRLRTLRLDSTPFPGLPKLLLSTHHLVNLHLYKIPDPGFISPRSMVACLSSLTNLRALSLGFRPRPRRTNQRQPPLARTVLPSLASLSLSGVSEYLEDFMARIDVPLLDDINITFFHQLIFNTPQLSSFIIRTGAFEAFHRAEMLFSYTRVQVTLRQEGQGDNGVIRLGISCNPSDWQLSSLAQVCNLFLPHVPTLEHLRIYEHPFGPRWQDDMEDTQWLELLQPFITVKSLYLDEKFTPRVAQALHELARESVMVLPALQNVFVQGTEQVIEQFVAARQSLGHPIAVHDWDGKW